MIMMVAERSKLSFYSSLSLSLFIWVQDWVKTEFQTEALTLIQNITENRTRHTRGPVQNISSVTYLVSCQGVVQLGGLSTGFSWFSPTKVKDRKSFLFTESSLVFKINQSFYLYFL